MTFRRAIVAAFSTAVLLGLAWGCSATGDLNSPAAAGGNSNGSVDAASESTINLGNGETDAGSLHFNPLCGDPRVDSFCLPDSTMSCSQFKPSDYASPSGDASTDDASTNDASTNDASTNEDAATSAEAGENGGGGAGGDSAVSIDPSGAGAGGSSGAGEGGTSGVTGVSGAAGASGATSETPMTPGKYGCQVQRTETAPKIPFSRCALAGPGGENAPCLTSSDCQAGLGCVGDQTTGTCQHYCCQDTDDCAPGTYCTERPMRDAIVNASVKGTAEKLQIPVCVHAENCDLGAPYPCPKGSECACSSGTACMVVRSDGTTTCAPPGTGKLGEKCPCAWGHVCSAATNTCLKLCYTRDASPCGTGKCQSASQLPDGWGVCIGLTSSGG